MSPKRLVPLELKLSHIFKMAVIGNVADYYYYLLINYANQNMPLCNLFDQSI